MYVVNICGRGDKFCFVDGADMILFDNAPQSTSSIDELRA